VHDLHRRRARGGLHRPHVRGHEPTPERLISAHARSPQPANQQASQPHALQTAERVTSPP
jgi:hypothetical protein